MAPEQTKTYMQAFSGWQRLNPKTKLGRPPPGKKIFLFWQGVLICITMAYVHEALQSLVL